MTKHFSAVIYEMCNTEFDTDRCLLVPFSAWMIPLHGDAGTSKEILTLKPFNDSARAVSCVVSGYYVHSVLESSFVQFCDGINRSFNLRSLEVVVSSEVQVGIKIANEVENNSANIFSKLFRLTPSVKYTFRVCTRKTASLGGLSVF